MNATTVHVRRPGNPKKWRARVLCEGIICDLALLTVDEPQFWSEDLMSLHFVAVPELQARAPDVPPSCALCSPGRLIERCQHAGLTCGTCGMRGSPGRMLCLVHFPSDCRRPETVQHPCQTPCKGGNQPLLCMQISA